MHVDEKLTNETFPAEPEKATLEGKISLSVFGYFLEAKQCCSLPYSEHI
ncbi:Cytochrome c oxidase subunit 3 [Bacillus thuringiensis serovar berliner ATCC 10792]|nr:Cytochrome c oxidase subunit 3 [Bacillus thuringiensis serovar berliner ATCC 10792]